MTFNHNLRSRTFEFAVAVFTAARVARGDSAARIIRNQLIRASASAAANYRAACRGRSRPEFIAKLGVALEEADESLFWLEFIVATRVLEPTTELQKLRTEANELVAVFATSLRTARANLAKEREKKVRSKK
jgi:four helix bundle protein